MFVLLLAGLAAAYWFWEPAPSLAIHPRQDVNAVAAPPAPRLEPTQAGVPAVASSAPAAPVHAANALELSHDLRSVYRQFKDSRDASERHMAYRAWSACFPTFIAAQGQAASIDELTRAFPGNDPRSAQRAEAYRSLQARCWSFSDMAQVELMDAARRQQEASYLEAALSPGELASKYLSDGKRDEALRAARAIVASQDPFAIGSLRELISQMIVLQVDAQMAPASERADLRSLAFTLAACQMGLECGAASLTALQMCASLGACSGSVTDRYLQALPNQADRDALALETRRVLQAIGAGNFRALGL